MTSILADSFDVSSVGRQYDSKKESLPSYSFGTGSRDVARLKLFISKKHQQGKAVLNSPGPVYSVPSTVGKAPCFSFGADETRHHHAPVYPDSSIDLTCATVDSQKVKFHSTPGVHFGTEPRLSSKNAEIVRTHPGLLLGTESPGALEYNPQDHKVRKNMPTYSFGPSADKPPAKPVNRISLLPGCTPRHVGPGSHNVPAGIGPQPQSARPSLPAWSMGGGGTPRVPLSARLESGTAIELDATRSSMGKQVVSTQKTSPACGFGRSNRDHVARMALCMTHLDKGPVATMPKPSFNYDLPAPAKIRSPGH